jgi:hypothetical protein
VHGAAFSGSGGATARHQHTVPIHGHTLGGALANATAANATNAHENRPAFVAINFILRGR